jgi:hypothetical protein
MYLIGAIASIISILYVMMRNALQHDIITVVFLFLFFTYRLMDVYHYIEAERKKNGKS